MSENITGFINRVGRTGRNGVKGEGMLWNIYSYYFCGKGELGVFPTCAIISQSE
jgi:superfamily II DNA/RNA helicase